jgi:hypothetical protein
MSNRGWQPAGTDNFRDLGGRPTVDGGRVRRGLVFRSDTLQEISPADAEVLVEELGVRLIIDLRLRAESEREGHGVLADRPLRIVNLPLDVADRESAHAVPALTGSMIIEHYLGYLRPSAATVVSVMTLLADTEAPAIVHCAAGKDRTGVMAALVLGAVGTPDAEIVADYADSDGSVERVFARLQRLPSYGQRLGQLPADARAANPGTMAGFLDELKRRHQSVPGLLRDLGVPDGTLSRLTDRLVEH